MGRPLHHREAAGKRARLLRSATGRTGDLDGPRRRGRLRGGVQPARRRPAGRRIHRPCGTGHLGLDVVAGNVRRADL